jgi:hypothetical protein
MRRTLGLWLLLLGLYAATLGLDAVGSSDYGADERRYLRATESLAGDGDAGVRDEYGVAFPLLILPARTLAGQHGVELFLAAIAALAVVLGYRLALHVVPDPWAIGGAVLAGASPPLLAYGTAVYPELTAAAALAGAALLAVRLDTHPRSRPAFGCFALLSLLPWLGMQFVVPGIVVGYFAGRALWRARRRTLAVGSIELSLFSLALYVGINEALYGGPTPASAEGAGPSATDAAFPGGYLERLPRLAGLLVDPEDGLLRWAPAFALALAGGWWLWRSHRDGLARAVPQLREIELTGDLCAAVLLAQVAVAALLTSSAFGPWFPGRHLLPALPLAIPLVAWGLRRAPRLGAALGALTLATSLWLHVDVRWAGGALVGD